ncbi:lantibiotic dehydratase [Pontibacter litorisediminis]|uniref:lantibiotic dehydratase n=1 Tax=Pontibacter litorisediminis TaxID=1846260 RepID=UPI0023ED474D|nr:lantibiotic dehydratase [Pontibacter litorisediminis]
MFKLYPRLLLRTPAFPFTAYATADLSKLVHDPYFQAALQLASPSLFQALSSTGFNYEALPQKVKVSLRKYLNRMCFRPTPFGLFSGFSIASWAPGAGQPLKLEEKALQVHLNLTFAETLQLAEKLLTDELAPHQRFKPNRSLYKVPGGYRYLRYTEDKLAKRRAFSIDSLQGDRLLQEVLRFCGKGPTRQALVDFVTRKAAVGAEESEAYVGQLIAEQVLTSNLHMNITGQDYLERLLQVCVQLGVDTPGVRHLQELLQELQEAGKTRADWQHALLRIRADQEYSKGRVYANLEKGLVANSLCAAYQTKILEALHCLQRLVPQALPAGLKEFIRAFEKKFEGRAVPLLVALDPELGVGYEELAVSYQVPKLLEELSLDNPGARKQVVEWSAAHALLLEKWQAAGPYPSAIRLTEQDVEKLSAGQSKGVLPPSTAVLFRVVGEQVYVEQAGGVSATALLGRFTPLNPSVQAMAQEIAQAEEQVNPEVVFAEIAHVSDAHTANIDRRAAIRSYEIPVLVQSTFPEERQIHLSELWVHVERGEIVLWSERLQKVVVPRLGSAFNYVRDDLAIFRFLCDLQYQGLHSNFSLDMSRLFPKLSYYPRVEYKGAILQLASWHLGKGQLERVLQVPRARQQEQLRQLAQELHWPRNLALTQHDQQLVFDLEQERDRVLLLENLQGKADLTLKEFPFTDETAPAVTDGAHQPYVHQFLAAAHHDQPVYRQRLLPSRSGRRPLMKKRKRVPGDEWLYFKIYCHPSRANSVLTETLYPLFKRLRKEGEITQWFFVRYRDPAYHLRVRLRLAAGKFESGDVLDKMSRKLGKLVAQGFVQDFQLAVYERELERYSPALIEAAEQVFCASSALVVSFIKGTRFSDGAYLYYRMAFDGMITILDAFGLGVAEKVALLGQVYASFYREFGQTKELKVQLATKYREISKLPGVLPGTGSADCLSKVKWRRLECHFREALAGMAQRARRLPPERRKRLISDLMHMHLNRLLIDQPRQQELVLYYCLWREFSSLLAKARNNHT